METLDMIYEMLCVFVPCMIYQRMVARKSKKVSKKHLAWVAVFVFYLYLCLDVVGMGSIWQIGRYQPIIRIDEINLIPFSSDGIATYLLNIIMFIPLGFLLPLIWKSMRKPSKVFWTSFGFSFGIEFCQLFNRRVTDIDDLMMNTLGGMFGFLIWKMFAKVIKKEEKIDNYLSQKEPIFYVLLAILGRFLFYNGLRFVMFLEKMGF